VVVFAVVIAGGKIIEEEELLTVERDKEDDCRSCFCGVSV